MSELNMIYFQPTTVMPILTISTIATLNDNPHNNIYSINNVRNSYTLPTTLVFNFYNGTPDATKKRTDTTPKRHHKKLTESKNTNWVHPRLEPLSYTTSLINNVTASEFNLTQFITTSGSSVPAKSGTGGGGKTTQDANFQNKVIVPLYAVIFFLSVIGNFLVIFTLTQNKRMRTVTNVYLLNLAISDLLLGVFCMPFTLVGQVLRNFVFGAIMCKLIPYFQAVSVSVAVWTLVAISLERYFAICRPLTSRRWQTQFHAYKMIALVWIVSFTCNSPLVIVQQLQPMPRGNSRCREVWPSQSSERTYVIFLDIALLLLPLISMSLAYSLIVSKLWRGLKREMKHTINDRTNSNETIHCCNNTSTSTTAKLIANSMKVTPVLQNSNNNHQYQQPNSTRANRKSMSTSNNSAIALKPPPPSIMKKHQNTESVKKWLLKSIVSFKSQESVDEKPHSGTVPQLFRYQNNDSSLSYTSQREIIRPDVASAPVEFSDETMLAANKSHAQLGDGDGVGVGVGVGEMGPDSSTTYTFCRHAIRSTNMDKSIEAKKKVIRMLFVIIVEFFVCWTPLHILNTVFLFEPSYVYNNITSTQIALVQLMAYISSCCNPITYCFMNRRFRQSFMAVFNFGQFSCCCGCRKSPKRTDQLNSLGNREFIAGVPCNSDASGNDSILYECRDKNERSEVLVLEAEDRV